MHCRNQCYQISQHGFLASCVHTSWLRNVQNDKVLLSQVTCTPGLAALSAALDNLEPGLHLLLFPTLQNLPVCSWRRWIALTWFALEKPMLAVSHLSLAYCLCNDLFQYFSKNWSEEAIVSISETFRLSLSTQGWKSSAAIDLWHGIYLYTHTFFPQANRVFYLCHCWVIPLCCL